MRSGLTCWPMLLSHSSKACVELSSAATPPPAGWSSASASWGTCCSHFWLSSGKGPRPFPAYTPTHIRSVKLKRNTLAAVVHPAWGFYNLKLGLAVRSVLVPFDGCTHQVIEARVPEIRHDVVAPPKCVQLILLHGGLNLEVEFQKENIHWRMKKHSINLKVNKIHK